MRRITLFSGSRAWMSVVLVMIVGWEFGCTNRTSPPSQTATQSVSASKGTPTSTSSSDDSQAVQALSDAGAELKRDRQGQVVEVKLTGNVPHELLEAMARLPKLRSVNGAGSAITNESIPLLAKISTLQSLDLRDCKLSNQAMESLSTLSHLKVLRLSGLTSKTDVDDVGVASLGKLPELKVLALDGLFVSTEGLKAIATLPLEELYLSKTLADDSSMEVICKFPKLKKLRLSKKIGNDGLAQLVNLPQLELLDLTEMSKLSDEGMVHVGKLTSLKHLNLWRVGVTDTGVQALSGLVNLQWLNLDNTQLTDESLPALAGMKKLEFLHLGSTAISNAGMPALAGLTSLKELIVTRTAVTDEGVAELQTKLSQTKIKLIFEEKTL